MESDRFGVEEARKIHRGETTWKIGHRRQLRDLITLARGQVHGEDLDSIATWAGTKIGERDPRTVGAERESDVGLGNVSVRIVVGFWVAAGCSNPAQTAAVRSDDEDPFLIGWNLIWDREVIREVRELWQFYRDRRPESYGDMIRQLP